MKKSLPFVACLSLMPTCLALLCANPSFAATTPLTAPASQAEESATGPTTPVLQAVRISYLQNNASAEVRLSGLTTGADYLLVNTDTRAVSPVRVDADDDSIIGSIGIEAGRLNHLELQVWTSSAGLAIRVPITADDRRDDLVAPKVEVVEHADTGRADVTVSGKAGATVRLYDSTGQWTMSALLQDTSQHVFDLPLADKETAYAASQFENGAESERTSFSLSVIDATLPPFAPVVRYEIDDGTRALLLVSGEPKAVVKVRDADGRTVAIRMLGSSRHAQVWVPKGTATDEVRVTQARGTQESAAARVDLTGTPTR